MRIASGKMGSFRKKGLRVLGGPAGDADARRGGPGCTLAAKSAGFE
jgi:hypothetical protein